MKIYKWVDSFYIWDGFWYLNENLKLDFRCHLFKKLEAEMILRKYEHKTKLKKNKCFI